MMKILQEIPQYTRRTSVHSKTAERADDRFIVAPRPHENTPLQHTSACSPPDQETSSDSTNASQELSQMTTPSNMLDRIGPTFLGGPVPSGDAPFQPNRSRLKTGSWKALSGAARSPPLKKHDLTSYSTHN